MKTSASFSTGHLAYKHDMRISIKNNVSTELSKNNIVLIDKIQGQTIEEYTNKRWQYIIEDYNKKQSRNDRKIKGTYTEWQATNGNLKNTPLAIEAVAQIDEHEGLGRIYYNAEEGSEAKAKLYEFYKSQYTKLLSQVQNRFPHMDILSAVIHFDEKNGTPHMHMIMQPVGEYTKGLPQQISISKALANDGIERVKNKADAIEGGFQLSRFYAEVREGFMERNLKDLGFELKPAQHGKKHEEPDVFIAKKKAQENYQEQLQKLDAIMSIVKTAETEAKEIATLKQYDPNKVIKYEEGGLFKKGATMYKMDEDTFKELNQSSNIKEIEYKIEQSSQKIEKALHDAKKLSSKTERVEELEKELEQAKNEVRELRWALNKEKEATKRLKGDLAYIIEWIKQNAPEAIRTRLEGILNREQHQHRSR